MQFRKSQKIAIRDGRLTRTFRTWKRPQAKTGGRYNIPPYGALEVEFVQQMKLKEIPPGHVRDAGYQTHEEVASHLGIHLEDTVWSIAFRYLGERPVNQPDRSTLDNGEKSTDQAPSELEAMIARLARMDRDNPWTHQALKLIHDHPGTRAGDLAPSLNMETATFKRQVRKLKAQGLTISLETGYRLSARGKQVYRTLSDD